MKDIRPMKTEADYQGALQDNSCVHMTSASIPLK